MTAVIPARGAPTEVAHERVTPARRPEHRRGQHLRPVERPRPKRSPLVPALVGVGIVIAALFGLAGMHAVLIGGQVELDAMRSGVASETEAIRRLELRVAELESPDRVLDAARDRLGMVQPAEVGYLLPVSVEGAPEEPVRVEAASIATSEVDPDAEETTDATTDAGADVTADADADADPDEGTIADELSEGGRDE